MICVAQISEAITGNVAKNCCTSYKDRLNKYLAME